MKHFLLLFVAVYSFSTWSAEISGFTPQGSVKDLKQVVVKFQTEMVWMKIKK